MVDLHVMMLPSRKGKVPPGTVCAGVNVNGEFGILSYVWCPVALWICVKMCCQDRGVVSMSKLRLKRALNKKMCAVAGHNINRHVIHEGYS